MILFPAIIIGKNIRLPPHRGGKLLITDLNGSGLKCAIPLSMGRGVSDCTAPLIWSLDNASITARWLEGSSSSHGWAGLVFNTIRTARHISNCFKTKEELRRLLSSAAYPIVPRGSHGQGAAGRSIHKILLAINIFFWWQRALHQRGSKIECPELACLVYREVWKFKNKPEVWLAAKQFRVHLESKITDARPRKKW